MFMDFYRCKANQKKHTERHEVFQWIRFSPTSTVPIFTCFSELGIAPGTARLPPRLLRLLLRPPTSTVSGGCRWKASSSPQISTPIFYPSKVSNPIFTLPETNIALKIGVPKRKLIFQPSIFTCDLLVSGRVYSLTHVKSMWNLCNCTTWNDKRIEAVTTENPWQISKVFGGMRQARSKAPKSTGHRVVRIYEFTVPNSTLLQNRFPCHLVSIQRSTAFHTLSVIIYVFFIYRHWICTTTSTAKLFDIQILSAPNNHLESMRVHHYSTFALARVGWHWRSTTPAMNLS